MGATRCQHCRASGVCLTEGGTGPANPCQYTDSTKFSPTSTDDRMSKDGAGVSSGNTVLITYLKADSVPAIWMLVILTFAFCQCLARE